MSVYSNRAYLSLKYYLSKNISMEIKKKIAEKISYYMAFKDEYHNEDGSLDVFRTIGLLNTKITLIEQANEYIIRTYSNSYYQGQWVKELKELHSVNCNALQTVLKMSRAMIRKGITTGIYIPEKESSNE